MLELRMAKGSLFEKVLEAIVDLVNVANVDCSSNGLSLQALHTENVALLSIFFPSEVFQSYLCDEDRSMGIAIADMVKFLRASDNGDIITIEATDQNFEDITITFESPNKTKTTAMDLFLVDARSQRLKIPYWRNMKSKYQAVFCMPSAEFMGNCKSLSDIDDDVVISVDEEVIRFFTLGKSGCMNISHEPNKTDKPGKASVTLLRMQRAVSLTLSLRYMKSYAKVCALFDQVKIGLSTTQPVMVECKIEQKGYIRYFLAPKILIGNEEEEEGKTEIEEAGSRRKKAKRKNGLDRKEDKHEERLKKKGSGKIKNDEKEDQMLG